MQHTEKEYLWLNYIRKALNNHYETLNNIPWAAYNASSEPQQNHVVCPNSLLPLFCEPAHRLAMIKHSFNVIKSAVDHLNPWQIPVIAFDQPLYAWQNKSSETGQISTVKIRMWSCLVAFTLK